MNGQNQPPKSPLSGGLMNQVTTQRLQVTYAIITLLRPADRALRLKKTFHSSNFAYYLFSAITITAVPPAITIYHFTVVVNRSTEFSSRSIDSLRESFKSEISSRNPEKPLSIFDCIVSSSWVIFDSISKIRCSSGLSITFTGLANPGHPAFRLAERV